MHTTCTYNKSELPRLTLMNMFVVGYVTAAVTAADFVNHHFLKVIIIHIGGYMPPLASTGCAAI